MKFSATYSSVELSTSQIVLAVIVQDQIDFEILLSLLSYKHTITFNSRREEITNLGIVDSLSLSLRKTDDRQTKILVNPWTLGYVFNTRLRYMSTTHFSIIFSTIFQFPVYYRMENMALFVCFTDDQDIRDNRPSISRLELRTHQNIIRGFQILERKLENVIC